MNTDRTFQIFVQCIFKSIMESVENSDLCSLSSSDDHSSAFSFVLPDIASSVISRPNLSRTFSTTPTTNSPSTSLSMSSYKILLENVAHFIERMVDKVWDIDYRDPKQIFEFVIKILNQAKKRGANSFMESLYRSLNRIILFELSRKIESIGGQNNEIKACLKY